MGTTSAFSLLLTLLVLAVLAAAVFWLLDNRVPPKYGRPAAIAWAIFIVILIIGFFAGAWGLPFYGAIDK